MKQQVLVFCALLSLIFSPVVALGRPLVASAAAADPMFQVQVPGVFKQKAFPVDATAGKSVPGVVTLADAESAFAGRGGLAASASARSLPRALWRSICSPVAAAEPSSVCRM